MTLAEAAAIAPLGTAGVATAAAIIAGFAIHWQGVVARRRAAVDFFLKTEMDKWAIELYTNFKEEAQHIKNLPSMKDYVETAEHKEIIRPFLNICELIAVGVNHKVFSDTVSWHYWGYVIPHAYSEAAPLIEYIRVTRSEGDKDSYADMEKLSKRWQYRGAFFEHWCYG
jgi:hypothetical protein